MSWGCRLGECSGLTKCGMFVGIGVISTRGRGMRIVGGRLAAVEGCSSSRGLNGIGVN